MTIVSIQPDIADRVRLGIRVTFRSVIALLRLWRGRARDRAQLARFTERDLRDIGITRADAHREINKSVWRT